MGPQFLILVTYLKLKWTKNKPGILGVSLVVKGPQWGPIGLQVQENIPQDPAEVGKHQSSVVGKNTGPSVPHTSHIFDY